MIKLFILLSVKNGTFQPNTLNSTELSLKGLIEQINGVTTLTAKGEDLVTECVEFFDEIYGSYK